MAGSLDEESFVIQWDNGFQSHPVFENEHPQCNEDKDRFVDYVRTVVPNMENPRVVDFVNRVSWEGCNVLRHDHDAKYDWCTFHPEARNACSCVCDEVNHPKPVCSHDQIRSWIHRDLSYECLDLFQTMSEQIISRIDDMATRIDDLEHNINDLMVQAGQEGTPAITADHQK